MNVSYIPALAHRQKYKPIKQIHEKIVYLLGKWITHVRYSSNYRKITTPKDKVLWESMCQKYITDELLIAFKRPKEKLTWQKSHKLHPLPKGILWIFFIFIFIFIEGQKMKKKEKKRKHLYNTHTLRHVLESNPGGRFPLKIGSICKIKM